MRAIVTSKGVMPSLRCERSAILLCVVVLAFASTIYAQSVGREGVEYSMGAKPGNQTSPHMAIGSAGGYLVWQDNVIDGIGKSYGIAARRLGSQLEPLSPTFRVNAILAGPQENPQVALMTNGGAAFVWQGGKLGAQDIYFRTYTPGGALKPALKEVMVNPYNKGEQSTPVITCLSNGNLAVAWCSLHQDKGLDGIYARVLTPAGAYVNPGYQVNQFTANNQRSPAIATLSNGWFIVTWVSENQGVGALETLLHTNRVHLYARVFTKGGYAACDEFRVNTRSNICATPSVTQWGSQGFTITWAERSDIRTNTWDIYARTYSAFNTPVTDAVTVNETLYGDQTGPQIAQVGAQQLVVWNSLGQDAFLEGVFGRFLTAGIPVGPEFQVNTYSRAAQIQQAVASDNKQRLLVAWSSYMGETAFDVQAQKYVIEPPETQSRETTLMVELNRVTGGNLPPVPPPSLIPISPSESVVTQAANELRVSIANTTKGKRLSWNAEPGGFYQVQYSTNFSRWENVGEPVTATSTLEWTSVGSADSAGFYRVTRVQ